MRTLLLAKRAVLTLLAGSLVSPPASADRVYLALDQTVTGRSNLFRTPDNEVSDGSYEIRPRLRAERPAGRLQYELEYSPSYDVYFTTNGLSGFDQFARAEASYLPVPAGRLWGSADIAYFRSIRSANVDGPDGIPEVVPGQLGRVLRGIADLGYEHRLGRATVASATFALQAYDYTTPNNADSLGVGGALNLVHELRPNLALGGTLFASHRNFGELAPQPESDNTVLHAGMIIRAMPTPTLTLEVEAGPAFVLTDRNEGIGAQVLQYRTRQSPGGTRGGVFLDCGTFAGQPLLSECPFAPAPALQGLEDNRVAAGYAPGGRPPALDDQTWTAFARVGLRKEESWGYAALDYFRAEDASSGTGTTSIRDSVTATLLLQGGNRWSARLRGNWNLRESVDPIDRSEVAAQASSVPAGFGQVFAEADELLFVGSSRANITQYWVDLTLRRRLLDRVWIEGGVRYLHQDRDAQGGGSVSFDDVTGSVTVRLEFPGFEYEW